MNYRYWEKYKLKVEKFENGTGYSGKPQYPNGHLLATLIGHEPMRKNSYPITFDQEINLIEKLVKTNNPKERYPLIDECGQICIYSENSFLYDTLQNGSVIGKMDSLDCTEDEIDEIPIMSIPTKDKIGLLMDTNRYHKSNTWKFRFSGKIIKSDIETIHQILKSNTEIKSELRYRVIGEQIRAKTAEYEFFVDSFNNIEMVEGVAKDDFDIMFEFNCSNDRSEEIVKYYSRLFSTNNLETDLNIHYEYQNKIVIDDNEV